MPKIRVATFNVENLFSRAKAINLANYQTGTVKLKLIGELQDELSRQVYSAAVKTKIINLYEQVKDYITFNIFTADSKVGRYLISQNKSGKYKVNADGSSDWVGVIEFKRDKFDEIGDKNTAKVIKDIKADILCLVEVENRLVLKQFNSERLNRMYPENMLVDGNDLRGIDVGLFSKFKIVKVRSNIFEGTAKSPTFPRDCLEVEVLLNNGESIYFLLNHFTSKGSDTTGARRKKQSEKVRDILNTRYDLAKQKVVVAGDLNDTADSAALMPLLNMNNLFDVLALQFPNDDPKRWTYHYKKNEQIDFILVSKPLQLHNVFQGAGVFRKGMADVAKFTVENETSYPEVTSWRYAASDHGAVWADFNL